MDLLLRILRAIGNSLALILFAILATGSGLIVSSDPGEAARRYTRPVEFDFAGWTADALGVKLGQVALGTPFYFNAAARHQLVVDYMHLLDSILQDEHQLNLIYTDPSVKDPGAASAGLRAKLDGLYARQRQLGPPAEAILQEQVAATLASLGMTGAGQPVPPVFFHMTPLPYNLVISPRNNIYQLNSISLSPDLAVDRQTALEDQVDAGLHVSSLVVPVGGIGTYPTMVQRVTALNWLTDTIAHEWAHNWLTVRPLGIRYYLTPELRTMNETSADICGGEVGEALLRRYYPELVHDYTLPPGQTVGALRAPARAGFDFRAEMHTTRVHVDELLKQGRITDAEAYMAQRRQVFWNAGYAIRKLNQAYFAFYGAYADVPGGAAGEDPVGPAVRLLRAKSPSLAAFMNAIGFMKSFKQLQDTLAQ